MVPVFLMAIMPLISKNTHRGLSRFSTYQFQIDRLPAHFLVAAIAIMFRGGS
jgi:hypothetical protein